MRQTEYKAKDREVKRQIAIGRGKRNWTERIAEEAEEAANKQHTGAWMLLIFDKNEE